MRRRRPQRGALAERLASVTAIWGGVRARGPGTCLKSPASPAEVDSSATPVASRRQIFGLPKPFLGSRADAYVCSGRFRPNPSLLYEHMFSSVPQLLRNVLDTTVVLLTLEDGEEARREAEWEGRCPQSGRRLSAPVASSAGFAARTLSTVDAHGGAARDAQRLSAARGSQQAARALRSTCSARSRCIAERSAATAR